MIVGMEEIRVTCDTLRVTFSLCCYMTLSIRKKIRFRVDIYGHVFSRKIIPH